MISKMVAMIKKYFTLIMFLMMMMLLIILSIWISNRLIRHLDQKIPDLGLIHSPPIGAPPFNVIQ